MLRPTAPLRAAADEISSASCSSRACQAVVSSIPAAPNGGRSGSSRRPFRPTQPCFSSHTSGSSWACEHSRHAHGARATSIVAHASRIKAIENFSPKFELDSEAKEKLFKLLSSPAFCAQVARESGAAGAAQTASGASPVFTELLFQPVPWSINTPKGMPAEFMQYAGDPSFVIINVPPNFMFAAKISNPSRLCAIYRWEPAAS